MFGLFMQSTYLCNPPACLPVFALSLSLLRTCDHNYLKPLIIDSPKCS